MPHTYRVKGIGTSRGFRTTLAISMLMAKQTNTTTSFTMTTAMVKDEKGPLPSVSFNTAIYMPQKHFSANQTLAITKSPTVNLYRLID